MKDKPPSSTSIDKNVLYSPFIADCCFALFIVFISLSFMSVAIGTKKKKEIEFNFPVDSDILEFTEDSFVKFDRMLKVPKWSMEKLTYSDINGPANRVNDFYEPPDIPLEFRPLLSAYRSSGYDRGHSMPSADFKHDQETMNLSFSLVNIFPQNPSLNRGLWSDLEKYVRKLIVDDKTIIHVVTALIWYPENRMIRYQTLGSNPIHVPTHVGKSILVERNGSYSMSAWIFPNAEISKTKTLNDFKVSVDEFERKTGIDVYSELDDITEQKLESVR